MVALLAALTIASAPAAEPKRIYIGNDDHTDYMWKGDVAQYRAAFLSMLDYYMNQADSTATNPFDSRGRFNCDGSLWAWEYEHNRSADQFARLMDHVRDSTITLPLNLAVLCYGGMPAEAVLRSMYYAGHLERRYDLRFPLVAAMEDQTMPGGLASLWAGAGAQYSWRGVCGCASRTPWGERPREIYHDVGPDGHGVCLKWNTQRVNVQGIGGYLEASDPPGIVDYLDRDTAFATAWPWPVSAAFGYGGDALESATTDVITAAQARSTPDRRVIVSNEMDFFQDFLAEYGDSIPTFSGSFGNEWELYEASMGAVTSAFKDEIEKLRTAEALATLASLHHPDFMTGREAVRDSAWLAAGLYYEHDWTADGVVSRSARAQWQRDLLTALRRYVDPLEQDALATLAHDVATPGSAERHVVFNTLSWQRTDFADLSLAQAPPVTIVDVATGVEVPSQVMSTSPPVVRILAANVPSVGYRVYEVRPGAGASFAASATVRSQSFDNGHYAVTLGGHGSLTSIVDHQDGDRELVNGAVHDLGSGKGSVVVESQGPVSTTLRLVAGGTPSHQTRVTLYAGIDRIDIEGLVTQNFGGNVAYLSTFNLPGAVTRHEEVGMIAKVARAAQGGDYADQNTRTDYLTFGHFVDLSQDARGVTVSNWDSPFFRAGTSTVSTLDGTTPQIAAVVGMQVDGTSYGIANQGGDSQFLDRFALRAHGAYDPAAAMRFALEHQDPLVETRLTGDAGGTLPAETWSLLTISDPDLLLWALKPAEEGMDHGIIARVWNLADDPHSLALSIAEPGLRAIRTTHLETDLWGAAVVDGTLRDELARQQLATYRLLPSTEALAVPRSTPPALGAAIYPNPSMVTQARHLAFTLPERARTRIALEDVRGARVATLLDATLPPGPHDLRLDGPALANRRLAPGVYYVVLEALGRRTSRAIVMLQ